MPVLLDQCQLQRCVLCGLLPMAAEKVAEQQGELLAPTAVPANVDVRAARSERLAKVAFGAIRIVGAEGVAQRLQRTTVDAKRFEGSDGKQSYNRTVALHQHGPSVCECVAFPDVVVVEWLQAMVPRLQSAIGNLRRHECREESTGWRPLPSAKPA